jgi:thiamine pyrophosphokinase
MSLFRKKVPVLCNGKFPEHHIPLRILNEASDVVCCDGAAVKLLDYGREPYAIVGDMDSLPADLRKRFADRIFHDPDQETNDLTKAVEWSCRRGANEIVILGATGLREDHTIGNIALLADYDDFTTVSMLTDTGMFIPLGKSESFVSRAKQKVSIFAITPNTRISTKGLKYNVNDRCFINWNQGTLNEATGNSFQINFDRGKLIVFIEY